MVIDAWSLYYAQKDKDKCTKCQRKIIDNMKTNNGCIWCDVKYHNSKKVLALKKLEEIQNG